MIANILIEKSGSIITIGAGLFLIYGTWRRWKWLVDPPENMASCYSQSFIKKYFGQGVLITFTYGIGVAFVLFGVIKLGLK